MSDCTDIENAVAICVGRQIASDNHLQMLFVPGRCGGGP